MGRRIARLGMIAVTIAIPLMPVCALAQPSPPTAPGATVDELLALVRQFNPDLAAAALESEAAVARIYPAGALDDPMLEVSRQQGFRMNMVTVSQEFPLWGKRTLRKDQAKANSDVVRSQQGTVLQELQEQVKIVFAQYYAAENAVRVIHDIRTLLRAVAETTRSRYAQGLGAQADVIRADLEESRLELELSNLERDGNVARARINALIARPADAELAAPATLRKVQSADSLALGQLMARARNINPMLAGARAQIAAAEDERQLVQKSWYPDVMLSVGGAQMPNMPLQPIVGVGIKIPLQWGVRRAQEQAAVAQRMAAQTRLDGTLVRLEGELQTQLANLSRAQRNVDVLATTLTQQSEAAYESSLASYQTGRGDLTSVLDTVREQLQVRLDTLQAQMDEQSAFASIERLVGGDL